MSDTTMDAARDAALNTWVNSVFDSTALEHRAFRDGFTAAYRAGATDAREAAKPEGKGWPSNRAELATELLRKVANAIHENGAIADGYDTKLIDQIYAWYGERPSEAAALVKPSEGTKPVAQWNMGSDFNLPTPPVATDEADPLADENGKSLYKRADVPECKNCPGCPDCLTYIPPAPKVEPEKPAEPVYAKRDIESQGEHYMRHLNAMTVEGLHSKSDIAAELAHRDIERDAARRTSGDLTIEWKGELSRRINAEADRDAARDELAAVTRGRDSWKASTEAAVKERNEVKANRDQFWKSHINTACGFDVEFNSFENPSGTTLRKYIKELKEEIRYLREGKQKPSPLPASPVMVTDEDREAASKLLDMPDFMPQSTKLALLLATARAQSTAALTACERERDELRGKMGTLREIYESWAALSLPAFSDKYDVRGCSNPFRDAIRLHVL